MITLPLPICGKVGKIYHIADLHIRVRDRFEEYTNVFNKFIDVLQNDNETDFVVYIAGDVFHSRQKIEAHGIQLFLNFVKTVSAICPVWIIAGNHDIVQEEYNDEYGSIDIIESLLIGMPINVAYLKTTGHYTANNIGVGLVSIQDALLEGGRSGVASELPDFPDPLSFDCHITQKIAFFHGTIPVYPVEWFSGYDIVLLGDLHLQSINNAVKTGENTATYTNLCWTYPGSLIQQNHGEHMLGHGYNLIDLNMRTVTFTHIINPFGYVSFPEHMKHVDQDWFPKYLNVRAYRDKTFADVETIIKFHGKEIKSFTFRGAEEKTTERTSSDTDVIADIASQNSPEAWLQFSLTTMEPGEWVHWFKNQSLLVIPPCDINKVIAIKVSDRNERITKKITSSTDEVKMRKSFKLISMKWQNILCFGEGNAFDFTKMGGKIALINAGNGQGKTSLLETICIGLFGKGLPSRSDKAFSGSIISQQKRAGSAASVEVCLVIGESSFKVRRGFSARAEDTTKIHASKDTAIFDAAGKVVRQGKTAVDKWIEENMGAMDSFLLCCMITQADDGDFFQMSANDQKQLLDTALGIEVTATFIELLKESRQAHIAIEELTNSSLESIEVDHDALAIVDTIVSEETSAEFDHSLMKIGLTSLQSRYDALRSVAGPEEHEVPAVSEEIAKYELRSMVSTLATSTVFADKTLPSVEKRLLKKNAEYAELMKNRPNIPVATKVTLASLIEKYGDMERLVKFIELPAPLVPRPRPTTVTSHNAGDCGDLSRSDVNVLIVEQARTRERITSNQALVAKSAQHPYNPECEACRVQPWKTHLDDLNRMIAKDKAFVTDRDFAGYLLYLDGKDAALWSRWDKHQLKMPAYRSDMDDWKNLVLIDSNAYKVWKKKEVVCEETIKQLNARKYELLRALVETWKKINAARDMKLIQKAIDGFEEWTMANLQVENMLRKRIATGQMKKLQEHQAYAKQVSSRKVLLDSLCQVMARFHTDVYKDKVMPMLLGQVNAILSQICDDRPLFLENDTKGWYLRDGGSRPPIGRASGFQQFIIGIAMRIALGQIGASGIKPRQLFLDESFTSFDSSNLSRVPAFLKHLTRNKLYDSIILVTHLEELKSCAEVHVYITRKKDVSHIEYI